MSAAFTNVSNAGVVSTVMNELVEHNHDLPLRVGIRKAIVTAFARNDLQSSTKIILQN